MGVWSMTMTLSRFSKPFECPMRAGPFLRAEPISGTSARRKMSSTSVLLPEPLTPVTQVKVPSGNARRRCSSDCFRCAPSTSSQPRSGDGLMRFFGTGMVSSPVRYFAGERARVGQNFLQAFRPRPIRRRARRRPGRDRECNRPGGWCPRHARRRARNCRDRADLSSVSSSRSLSR